MRIKGHGIHYHIICRCNNGERLLAEADDKRRALHFLKFYVMDHKVQLYDYSAMDTHLHLLLMTDGGGLIDELMHDFCLATSRDLNRRHGRSGHFWRHPYKSKVIDDDLYALACLRYIDRNAKAAGIVASPDDWPWSGHRFYAFGEKDDLITAAHPSYGLLGSNDEERQRAWRKIVASAETPGKSESILFEGRCREGSRRFVAAYKQVRTSMGALITKGRYGKK